MRLWGRVAARCWLELKVGYVVVGAVGNLLLLMPDRTQSLLPEPAIFDPPGPLLLWLWCWVEGCYSSIVCHGLDLPVCPAKDFRIGQLR